MQPGPSRAPLSVAAKPGGSASSALLSIALLFALVWLAHWPLLRLPYYWDEAGYYIPAAFDFFRRGTLIPYSTLSNAHPPLPSLYLAGWWRVFGFTPLVTRSAMSLAASVALAAVYRLAEGVTRDRRVAVAVTLLTALYPVWFVQSTLAHADLLAATGTLWGLAFLLGPCPNIRLRRTCAASCCFALAALSKEIAIGTPLALALWELWLALRGRRAGGAGSGQDTSPAQHVQTALLLTTPAVPLAAWFAYHRWQTGFTFGNPEYLRYNATATLSPIRVLLALAHRAMHLTLHLNLFVPVMVTLGCLFLPPLAAQEQMRREDRARILLVLLANCIFFSVLGGALLTRYLLPLYPLVILLCVEAWRRRLHRWQPLAVLTAAAFLAGLFINPPYRFAPEDTLAYRDSILLQQDAIAQISARYGRPTILTAWPATDSLSKPELGYVSAPFPVVAIDNFSYPQIKALLLSPDAQPYTVALLFSTKYDPPLLLQKLEGRLGEQNRALDARYFDFHTDLPPQTIARLLGGTIVWQEPRHGQWAAVLHLDRPQLAGLAAGYSRRGDSAPRPALQRGRVVRKRQSAARLTPRQL